MRVKSLLSFGALVARARATAQDSNAIFEPQDFNVTAALEKIGVDVSKIPDPESDSKLTTRSLAPQCSHAASYLHISKELYRVLTKPQVYSLIHTFQLRTSSTWKRNCVQQLHKLILVSSTRRTSSLMRV